MIYTIFLDNNKIGTTKLEFADPPMGVVFGDIIPFDKPLTYDFLLEYCNKNNIYSSNYPEDKNISTGGISSLKVINEKGVEISGVGNSIEGMDSSGYTITIIGIDYPFYEEEFPYHRKAYDEQWSK